MCIRDSGKAIKGHGVAAGLEAVVPRVHGHAHGILPVSYTHLDVYKRQQLGIDVEHDYAPQYINTKDKSKLIKELKAKAKQRCV